MQSLLTVTALEARDNPSIPVGLADVPVLISELDLPEIGPGYVETHTITKSLTHTITLDQFGSGSDGTFVLDIVGETHPRDEASGAGGGVTGATGLLTTDVSYHLHIGGQYADGVFTATNQSYTETGSTTETHAYTIDTGSGTVTRYDGDTTHTWDVSWAGTVTAGALSFTSYSNVESSQTHWHYREDYPDCGYHDHTVTTGFDITESGSGTEESHTGRQWWEEHIHDHVIEPIGPGSPPEDYYEDNVSDDPLNGTAPLDTTPLEYEIVWNAAEATATNYTWHGETAIGGSLTETARWTDGVLDVNSFNSTSHFRDESHLIEDEPGVTEGGGQENAHLDETITYTADITGSGSYVGGSANADYQAAEVSTMVADDTYTAIGDESTGVDEEGEPYDLVFNYSAGQTTDGTFGATYEYHDGADGIHLVNSDYSSTLSSTTNDHQWGTRNGVGFDESFTSTDSGSNSFSIPGDNVPITDPAGLRDAYPFVAQDSSVFLIQRVPPTTPPNIPRIPNPRGGLRTGAGLLQGYYNNRIRKIGEDAKLKVGKLFAGKVWVMQYLDNVARGGTPAKASDTFTVPPVTPNGKPPGGILAQAMGQWSEFKKKEKAAIDRAKGVHNWTNVSTTSQVTVTYYVEPRSAPGQNRSGKCVVEYRINIIVNGTKGGRQLSENYAMIAGNFWFEDDNLKTRTLVGDP